MIVTLLLSSVVKLGDSSTWYQEEVSGQLLLKGDKYTYFKDGAIKVNYFLVKKPVCCFGTW